MDVFTVASRRYARIPQLAQVDGLVHAFTTRPLDVSVRADEQANVRAANRETALHDLGVPAGSLHYCRQVHRTQIATVTPDTPAGMLVDCDAVMTDVSGVPLMTFSADCPLVLLVDPIQRVVALVHASWRCTVARLTQRVVAAMRETYGCDPARIAAGIGPGAGPCCYEVRDDVYDAAAELPDRDTLFPRRDGRMMFDLWRANRILLRDAGVAESAITTAGACTMCRTDLFYSFRREGPGCGHFGLIAALRQGCD